MRIGRIVTVGICPAWDVRCMGCGLEWGEHARIDEQLVRPAGKAMNVSAALAWLGQANTAAGLWGRQDYDQMAGVVRATVPGVRVELTAARGRTRTNVTVVDRSRGRELHLRGQSRLASQGSLRRLRADLKRLVKPRSLCVFAGAMPSDGLLEDILGLMAACRRAGAFVVVDTSGPALVQAVRRGLAQLIKPNVAELAELLGKPINDNVDSLAAKGRGLLGQVGQVLISRGARGALLVTQRGSWHGAAIGKAKVISTVGCGDFLLAGYLKGLKDGDEPARALGKALKAAAARAWGWSDRMSWHRIDRQVSVRVAKL